MTELLNQFEKNIVVLVKVRYQLLNLNGDRQFVYSTVLYFCCGVYARL